MRFLTDENFEGAIYRGLLRRQPDLDIVRAQDVGLGETDDRDILEWAYQQDRIVLTHDRKTMVKFAYERLAAGRPFAGLLVMKHTIAVRTAIEDILLIAQVTRSDEWVNQVQDLPL